MDQNDESQSPMQPPQPDQLDPIDLPDQTSPRQPESPKMDRGSPDHASQVSEDFEENIPEEEWEQMKQEAMAKGDTKDPPKIRVIKRKIHKRKSTVLL